MARNIAVGNLPGRNITKSHKLLVQTDAGTGLVPIETVVGTGIADYDTGPYTAPVSGAVTRPVTGKLAEAVTPLDVGCLGNGSNETTAIYALTSALSAAGGGTVKFPSGDWNYTYSLPPNNVIWEFEGPMINRGKLGGGTTVNFRKATFGVLAGNHPTTRTSLVNITAIAEGSTKNGVFFGDVAHEIRIDKKNWSNPALAIAGEIDGQFIYCRQGGPSTGEKSALGGQVIDVGMTTGTGFLCHYEHVATVFDPGAGLAVTHQIDIQGGVLNTRDGDYYGHILAANTGTMDAAIFVKAGTGAAWGDVLRVAKTTFNNYKINDNGKHTWNLANATATTVTAGGEADGSYHIRDGSGDGLFSVDQTGVLTLRSTQAAVTNRKLTVGSGSPNGAVTGSVGDFFLRTDAGVGRAAWIKDSGSATNTGWANLQVRQSGTTANRPTGLNTTIDVGFEYFDTTLGKPIWWNGTVWKDATGTTV